MHAGNSLTGRNLLRVVATALLAWPGADQASASTLKTLYSFCRLDHCADGSSPYADPPIMDGPWEGTPDVLPVLTGPDSVVVVVVVLVVGCPCSVAQLAISAAMIKSAAKEMIVFI